MSMDEVMDEVAALSTIANNLHESSSAAAANVNARVSRILISSDQWNIILCLTFFYGFLVGGVFGSLNTFFILNGGKPYYLTDSSNSYNSSSSNRSRWIALFRCSIYTIISTAISVGYTLIVLLSGVTSPQTYHHNLMLIVPGPLFGVLGGERPKRALKQRHGLRSERTYEDAQAWLVPKSTSRAAFVVKLTVSLTSSRFARRLLSCARCS